MFAAPATLTQTLGAGTPADTSDDRYSGTLSAGVTRASHHAKGATQPRTFEVASIRLGKGVTGTPAAGTRVKVIGKITKVSERCDQAGAGVVTARKAVLRAPQAYCLSYSPSVTPDRRTASTSRARCSVRSARTLREGGRQALLRLTPSDSAPLWTQGVYPEIAAVRIRGRVGTIASPSRKGHEHHAQQTSDARRARATRSARRARHRRLWQQQRD
jgi:hypothetical protein